MSQSVISPAPCDSLLARYHDINVADVAPRPLPPLRDGPFVLSLWGKGGSGKTTTALQLVGIAAYLWPSGARPRSIQLAMSAGYEKPSFSFPCV